MPHPSAFKTPEGEAHFRAVYDAALKRWPVPYNEIDLPTPFGMTHVVAAGTKEAPPLLLLHGYMATSIMWGPNIADFANDYAFTPSTSWGNRARAFPVNRSERRQITSRG